MPRYFFALEGDTPEDDGDEFIDDMAALKHAEIVSEELGRNHSSRPRLAVYNERGERVRLQ